MTSEALETAFLVAAQFATRQAVVVEPSNKLSTRSCCFWAQCGYLQASQEPKRCQAEQFGPFSNVVGDQPASIFPSSKTKSNQSLCPETKALLCVGVKVPQKDRTSHNHADLDQSWCFWNSCDSKEPIESVSVLRLGDFGHCDPQLVPPVTDPVPIKRRWGYPRC